MYVLSIIAKVQGFPFDMKTIKMQIYTYFIIYLRCLKYKLIDGGKRYNR